jgi:hypothetical protein
MTWARHVPRVGRREVNRVLMGILERKNPFERPTCRWRDNIKINFNEVYWETLD